MKNNKIFLAIILVCFYTGMVSFAKTISENTAKTVGINFLKTKGVAITNPTDLAATYIATGTINGNTVTDYYVFNQTGGHAFVIVSADDNIIPILAYSDESGFDKNNMSSGTKDWIDGYRNQITAAIANNLPAKMNTPQTWSALIAGTKSNAMAKTTDVTPLLGSLIWDQSPYYNDSCPGVGVNQSPTGCVATAMAQVMKFWNWPSVGTGYHSYVCKSYNSASPMTLHADFGNTAYNWSGMPNSISSHNAAIAQLMYHAGVSVSMNYDTLESGSYVIELESYPVYNMCAEYALKTYFHYKPTMQGIPRYGEIYGGTVYVDSMTESSWRTMLRNELNAGRPVIYSGYGGAGGHCWVLDGWETSGNLFHFNWGWSGASNGYYTVDNLAPPALGVGGGAGNFNSDQCVIIGIQPDSFPSNPGNIKLAAHLNCLTSTPMKYGTSFGITTQILNSNSSSFTGDFSAQVFDTLNNLIGTLQTYTAQTISAGGNLPLTFGPSVMNAMVPMDYYHVQVMYRATGVTAWTPVANNGTFVNYTTTDVLDDTDIVLYGPITITTPLPVVSGANFSLHTVIANQGQNNFYGNVEAVMINVATGTPYLVYNFNSQHVNVNASFTFTFTNSAFSAPNGLYALVIKHQYNGTGTYYTTSSDYDENPILVNVGTPTSAETTIAEHDVYVFPNPANDYFTVLPHGVNITEIHIIDMQGNDLLKQLLVSGKATINLPVSGLASGIYFVRMQTETGVITKKIVIVH